MEYVDFIKGKTVYDHNDGIDVDIAALNPVLFDWQKAVVRWAIKKGKAALFEECGLGKSMQQIEWLKQVNTGIGLIVCPLSVAPQTINEASKLGYQLIYVKDGAEITGPGMYITNYERIHGFENVKIAALVADESSIFKSIDGKTKTYMLNRFKNIPFRLSCTATPSPNDISELGNQVEFLGIMSRSEMLSKFFINDAKAGLWRLKGHARREFYKWMASWAVFIRKPSDIGFSDEGYILPKLNIIPVYVDCEFIPSGELFPSDNIKGIQGRHDVRRKTYHDKIAVCKEMINKSDDQWIVWCGLNPEADHAADQIEMASQVKGGDSPDSKNQTFLEFKNGSVKVLVTKPKIAGFGMNFQNANNAAFIGLGDSFEKYYQCIRREYRFGQSKEVNVYLFLTNAEQIIHANIIRKEDETNKLYEEVVKEMQDFTKQELSHDTIEAKDTHSIRRVEGQGWTAILGDVCETIDMIENESIDMQIFSPPFFSLYTYSPSPRDIGNNGNDEEFWKHFSYLIPRLYSKLKPGRICAVHCMDTPALLSKDGYIGLKDLRGDIIREFSKHGYIYDGCAFIPKNPQAQSIRTHAKGLTFTQFEKDSSWSRPSLPDYLIKFRKPGENAVHVENGEGKEISRDDWIELASGVWTTTVRETHNLNTIKYPGDEAHMCPLQLDTIHNAVRLWSNPGELIQSPFGGIGSEGYQSILDGRRAVMHELKPEYFKQMCDNMKRAVDETKRLSLFDEVV